MKNFLQLFVNRNGNVVTLQCQNQGSLTAPRDSLIAMRISLIRRHISLVRKPYKAGKSS